MHFLVYICDHMVALQTFENLKPERQQQIIEVCLQEFSLHDYQTASLSDIIKKLELAKGSFYRYFESKYSLYLYLLNFCLETRLQHDSGLVQELNLDFFELYTQHFEARLQFEKKYPLHSAFLQNLLRQKYAPELGDIQLVARTKIVALMKPKIQEDIHNKKIRSDIDVDLMAFIMAQTQMLITDYVSYKYKIDYSDNLLNTKSKKIPLKEVVKVGEDIVNLLKNGFKK
jgi:TetR/AcrR family transcriptional regulator